jgi:hypothetical protein
MHDNGEIEIPGYLLTIIVSINSIAASQQLPHRFQVKASLDLIETHPYIP